MNVKIIYEWKIKENFCKDVAVHNINNQNQSICNNLLFLTKLNTENVAREKLSKIQFNL